jgi:pilin isopeptide linkage protein
VEGDDSTIKYTDDRVRVRVTIAEAGNGKVEATKCEYLTDAVFTNEYEAEGSLTLNGTKELKSSSGREMTVEKQEFNFVVKEGDTRVATGFTTGEDGKIAFTEIKYFASDIGDHTYVISENEGTDPSVQYTAAPVIVKVNVFDKGDGKLGTTVIYNNDENATEAKFVNGYEAASGSITLQGTKTLTGNRSSAVAADEFTFSVKETVDGVPTEVATGNTLAGGSIEFTPISYTRDDIGKTHTYVISENKGTDTTIEYTAAPVTVKVTVSDTGGKELSAVATYTNTDGTTNEAKFVNAYKATGSLTLTGTKELTGGRGSAIKAEEFEFKVLDAKGNKVATGLTKEGSNSSAQIQFTPVSGALSDGATFHYTQDDIGKTYTYVISEVKGTDTTIDYTEDTVTVTVTVSDAGAGQLNVTAKYGDNGTEAKFVNEYHMPAPTGIRVDILPYIMLIAIAICLGILLTICRRRRRLVRR